MAEDWKRLKETLKEPANPESMKRAAEEFKRWEAQQRAAGKKRSTPVICSLGYKKKYPSAVPLDKVSDEIATNPEFYELMRKVVGGKER